MLVLATPLRGSDPNAALVSYGWARFQALFPYQYIACSYEPVLARNRLAAMALEDEKTQAVLWADDDNFPSDPRIIQGMLDAREDLIGASYAKKKYPIELAHAVLPWGIGLGFGFTITSRRCLEKMTRAARIYTDHHEGVSRRVANLFGNVFSGPDEDDEMYSEDVSFCWRWSKLGGRAVLHETGPGKILHSGGHTFG